MRATFSAWRSVSTLAHVDRAVKAHERSRSGARDPVRPAPVSAMTRVLPIRLVSKRLPEHVVDLVRAGVVEVLTLEQDPRAAGLGREPVGIGKR